MQTKTGNIHLEIQTSRKNPVGLLRTTSWEKKKKQVKHTQHGRITGCSLEQLKMLQCAFREEVITKGDPDALKILSSRELGAGQVLLKLAKDLGLHRILYSRSEPWVDCALAMIIGRIVFQGSNLRLCNQAKNTALWELCGIEGTPAIEKQCYLPMDRLLKRQKAIQKMLLKKHVSDGSMVLYDITSSYFEGEYAESDWVTFGYNRAGKKGDEQVVIGLITNTDGCPIGCEVFEGNINDTTTMLQKVDEVRSSYGVKEFTFVGDRDTITQGRFAEIRTEVPSETLSTDSVINAHKAHRHIKRAFKNLKTVQLEMRPLQHNTADQIRAHVFLCMLAYYLQWNMTQRLQPLLDSDGADSEREWTFAGVIDCLKSRQQHTILLNGVEFIQDGEWTEDQQQIVDLLEASPPA